jgi:hypothetical protein
VASKRALSAPVERRAPVREGAAWPDAALPPEGREQVREYAPAGR